MANNDSFVAWVKRFFEEEEIEYDPEKFAKKVKSHKRMRRLSSKELIRDIFPDMEALDIPAIIKRINGLPSPPPSPSPIYNQNGLIVGDLTGGSSYCTATNQRLSSTTSGRSHKKMEEKAWHRVMIGDKHRFEVQIHHEDLVTIRETMGGHYIYAKFRALNEALEVTKCECEKTLCKDLELVEKWRERIGKKEKIDFCCKYLTISLVILRLTI